MAEVTRLVPEPELDREQGVSITLPFALTFDQTAELIDVQEVSVAQLVEMRKKDAQVRALLRLLTLPIRAAARRFVVEPAEGGEAEAEFIEQMLKLPARGGGMSVPLDRVLAQILLALNDGFAAFEIVYNVPKTGDLANKITVRKLAHRPSETVRFLADDTGGFAGLRQRTSYRGQTIDAIIKPPYAFYWAAQEEENPYYGQSYFLPAFYHWDKKVKLYYIAHLAAQIRAVPGRLGKLPANPQPKVKEAFRKGLEDFGLASAMLVPFGYEVTEFGASASGFDFVALINHHNQMQSKSILAEFLDKLDKTALVDFSTGENEMFLLSLQSIMCDIESTLNNHLFPNLIDWNFGSGKYPQFKFAPISDDQKKAIGSAFEKLATAASVQVTPQFIHELEKMVAEEMGLQIDYEEIDAQLEEEAEVEREAKIQQAKATTAVAAHTEKNPEPKPKPAPGAKVAASAGVGEVLSLADLHRVYLDTLAEFDAGDE